MQLAALTGSILVSRTRASGRQGAKVPDRDHHRAAATGLYCDDPQALLTPEFMKEVFEVGISARSHAP